MAGILRRDDKAASSVVAFLIAGVLFMVSVVAVLVTTRDSANERVTGDVTESARFDIQAGALAGILFGSPGYFTDPLNPTAASPLDWAHAADYKGWTPDADHLDRLGLRDPNARESFMMDFAKFQNLRRAGYKANPTDGYVNYEEAAAALGLSDAGLDFHIRAYPALDSVSDLLAANSRDNNLRVAYIGNIDVRTFTVATGVSPTKDLEMSAPTCTLHPTNPKILRVSVDVYNGGDVTTHFTAVTSIDLDPATNSKPQEQNVNGFLVPRLTPTTLTVDVPAAGTRTCAGGSATFDLYDPVHPKLMSRTTASFDGVGGVTSTPRGLLLDTGKQSYAVNEPIILNYDGVNLGKNDDLLLIVCNEATECTTTAGDLDRVSMQEVEAEASDKKREIAIGGLPEGQYTAWLYDCQSPPGCDSSSSSPPTASTVRVSERIVVTSSAISGYVPVADVTYHDPIYTTQQGPPLEVQNLELLMGKFCPFFYDSKTETPITGWTTPWATRCGGPGGFKADTPGKPTGQYGDVFPDSKKIMNEDLPARLICQQATCAAAGFGGEDIVAGAPRYDLTDILVVGSGVDHNAMTSQSAKGSIESWVHGGGTILVFGSTAGNVRWLEPLFHAAIVGSGEAISTPDQGHPMLHSPNELDNPGVNYEAHASAWRFNGQTAKAQGTDEPVFSNIIVAGDVDPLLALSNKGSFGGGTIIVTAFMPFDIYGTDPKGAEPRDPSCSRPYNSDTDAYSRTLEECEGMFFMHNMLMQGYADLFLEYGPEIPERTNVQPAIRMAQIRHPQFDAPIELTMIVYVF